jgi:Holliday junction resolvasome RuvABC endonuclease subunit
MSSRRVLPSTLPPGTKSLGIKLPGELVIPVAVPLLSLDVSSTASGYAIFGNGANDLGPFGVIKPRGRWEAVERIKLIVDAVVTVLTTHHPASIVMEWNAGKAGHWTATGGRKVSGLAVLGQAQGAVWQAIRERGYAVETVTEDEWTKRVKKEERAESIASQFSEYRDYFAEGRDSGFDAADAIGLGRWFLNRIRA